jgi:eukaryotic-like serine/threonine-protein kinase
MTLEQGALLIDRYRVIEVLGQGGMGSIYRAVDENLGVEVAIKENLFTIDDYARQFRREALILANLRHPNLPRVSDHFTLDDQGQYLIMDYIVGEDLQERMERIGQLPEEEVIYLGATICDALAYMHSHDPVVLHRDIKPANVRISPSGGVYLVDFGLAKIMHGNQTTTTGARAMTMGFSPPEQYGAARTDARTDIYSLGATLYTALTGFTPEDSLAQTMDQEDLTSVRDRNPNVSRRVAEAVEKALQVHPNDRFQMAAEFKNELLKAQSGRFNLSFGLDSQQEIAAKKADRKQAEKSIVRGVITKDVSGDNDRSKGRSNQEKARKSASSPAIDRGGCLGLLGLLALILVLGGVVFYLLNPELARVFFQLPF